jgi:uncharacterized spore protein YtfJ
MQDIATLFDKAVGEIERMLNTKTVVGEPINIEGATLIPLVSIGFGFVVGGGEGTESQRGSGHGGGTGGGGGVKPVAIAIVSDGQVRIEPIKSGTASVLEKAVETVAKASASKGRTSSE